ncbi:MAG: site-specific integrase [Deltaproteobacteria bacterium]|jgi:integrase|nr:site-specific integrase [Deltaproteobacteria bacterium]MBP6830342.1 site-specific integrase [Deltaproteobacteria bacterium]
MAKTARPQQLPSGRWRIRWIDHEGQRQSEAFETFADAERALRTKQTDVDEIVRGLKKAPVADRAVRELCDYWLKHKAPTKRSRADDESMIRHHLLPGFGSVLLRELSVVHVDGYREARSHLSPKTVRNHLTLLTSMLSLACDLGWIVTPPRIPKPTPDPDDDVRQPWLKSDEEIERLLAAARAEIEPDDPHSEVAHVLYQSALLTGMRAGELAGLRWEDVSLPKRHIDVRRSYDGKTKTRASRRHVPIVDRLLPTLEAWKEMCPSSTEGLVFPNRKGGMHRESARIFQEVLHRVLDRAGFERPVHGRARHCIHFHSLRHTFACHWMLKGGKIERLVRVMGHTSRVMTEHYANLGGYQHPDDLALFGAASAVA